MKGIKKLLKVAVLEFPGKFLLCSIFTEISKIISDGIKKWTSDCFGYEKSYCAQNGVNGSRVRTVLNPALLSQLFSCRLHAWIGSSDTRQ